MEKDKKKRPRIPARLLAQTAFAALFNGYAAGFAKGRIFTGKTKLICVPVLNCYSCPGALGSCPVGALQAVLSDRGYAFSFYVLGFLMLFGTLLGRLICGLMCPFGFIQDILHKIPLPKPEIPRRADRVMRYLKYLVLLVLVILLPALLTNDYGIGKPYFCKWICPAGTLEGGIPLLAANDSLRQAAGPMFLVKLLILAVCVVSAVFIYRPFCKYICPLGAVYSLFNRFSLYQMTLDSSACVNCGKCEAACGMKVDVRKNISSGECIRCGECKKVCPAGAIKSGFIIPRSEPLRDKRIDNRKGKTE